MQELIDYAASSQDEVCGLIVDGERLFKCENVHPQPGTHFRISDDDWLAAENEGEITAIFHSHPDGPFHLSGSDRQMQIVTDLPWWLAAGDSVRKFRPVPALLGRKFKHGVVDCYTLFRDAYHLCGVDLPDFHRADGWWVRGENLYIKNMAANGFTQVDIKDAVPGDVIIRQPFPGVDPSHAMILLNDDVVLHHDHAGHLSRREPFRPAYMKQTHSVWRYTKCSSLNLAAIYADFTVNCH